MYLSPWGPVPLPCNAIPRASPITETSVSNTSLFVPRYIFCVFQQGYRHATLILVLHVSRGELSVQNDTSPGASMFCEVALADSSLPPVKEAILPLNVSGSNNSVRSVPTVVSMLVPSMTVGARRYPSISCPLWGGHVQSSSSFDVSPSCTSTSPSLSVTRRMLLIGCKFSAASKRNPYFRCLLLSNETTGRSPVSITTIPGGAVRNIPVIVSPCPLTSIL